MFGFRVMSAPSDHAVAFSTQILGIVVEVCVHESCATCDGNIARIFEKPHKPTNTAKVGVSRNLLRTVSRAPAPMSAETLHNGVVHIAYGAPQLVEPKQKMACCAFVLRAGAGGSARA